LHNKFILYIAITKMMSLFK